MSLPMPHEAGGAGATKSTPQSLPNLLPPSATGEGAPLPLPSPFQQQRHQLQPMICVPPSGEVQGVPILYRHCDGTETPAPLIDELRRSALYTSTTSSAVSSARASVYSVGTEGSDVLVPSLPGSAAVSMPVGSGWVPAPSRLPAMQREDAQLVSNSGGDSSVQTSAHHRQGSTGDVSMYASVVKPVFNLSRSSQYEVLPQQPHTPYHYQQQLLLPQPQQPYTLSPFLAAPPGLVTTGPLPVTYQPLYVPTAGYAATSSSPGSGHIGGPSYPPPQLEAAGGGEEEPLSPRWHTGLFGLATDVPSAMDSVMCVYCISSAHFNYVYRQERGMFNPIVAALLCFDLCWCIQLWPVVTPLSSVTLHTFLIRRELRKRYNLVGNDLFVKGDSYNADTAAAAGEGEARAEEAAAAAAETEEAAAALAPPQATAISHAAAPCAEGVDVVVAYAAPCATWYSKLKLSDYWKNIVLDGLISCFCVPCAVAQHHREMSIRGDWPGSAVVSRSDFTAREQHLPQGGTALPIAPAYSSVIPVTGQAAAGVNLTSMT
ncbi:hypothetical protein LSCM1_08208 [Leishmania martiniquensis]|uniref:PLAC8 family protein n=1 Tax=Leishmania martiniquensis TaxID=1580590 RepID=A0A836I4B7_9TRYP|nr:hypothetical protein LSCM1_08208 [Leishmania martiniquensis]